MSQPSARVTNQCHCSNELTREGTLEQYWTPIERHVQRPHSYDVHSRHRNEDVASANECAGQKTLALKGPAVSQVGFNDHAVMQRKLFEGLFCKNSFDGREAQLMFNMEIAGAMINKQTSAFVGR